jgi:hypothetical protein
LAKPNQRRTSSSRIILDQSGTEVLGPEQPTDPDLAPADPFPPPERSRSPGMLSILLVAALAASLLLSLSLWIKLERTRDELAEAAEQAAVARRAGVPETQLQPAAPTTAQEAAPSPEPAIKEPAAAAPAGDRLLLLLTVGTRHYAEKQARELRQKCRAPLAVYQQKRGRCAFATCFAVAVPEASAGLARNCGETKGQTLRERTDFVEVLPGR